MAPPPRLRLDVERDPGLVYLDNAGRTPLPRCVLKAGERALKRKVRPWEGMGNDADVDDVRARYARIIGHDNGADIALCPSTSYSMSLAAHNLVRTGVIARGTEVLVLQNQMASNVMPWQSACRRAGARLRVVPSPSRTWTEAILRDIAQDDARAAPRIAVPDPTLNLALTLTLTLQPYPLPLGARAPAIALDRWRARGPGGYRRSQGRPRARGGRDAGRRCHASKRPPRACGRDGGVGA